MEKGIGVSRGIAIGSALVYDNKPIKPTGRMITVNEIDSEKDRAHQAVLSTQAELNGILDGLDPEDEMMTDLMEIQIDLAEDPMLLDKVNHYIEISLNEAGDAFLRSSEDLAVHFEGLENEYYRARATDIRDVGSRLAAHAFGVKKVDLSRLEQPVIIFADDITPSETVTMDKSKVLGFVTKQGSKTSHTAILAKMLEIPAVVGVGHENMHGGEMVIVDGTTGEVVINPSEEDISLYNKRKADFLDNRERLKTLLDLPAITTDGRHVELCINIADPREVSKIAEVGGDGVGLFRTEFLYMDSETLPTEEEQFNAYKTAAVGAKGKSVIIRTLDIGGDKHLPYLAIPEEDNPFLGYRAIRICLDNPDLFKAQLRAILRASVFGKIKIMFPMISSMSQLKRAKQLVDECKAELDSNNILYEKDIPIGIMVEIPAVAAAAELFAKEADFFSIGTNDLCQYSLAVDRMNTKIAGLYNHFNPGVLRLIKSTINAANNAGIPVGMCGEMASDLAAVTVLLGMGLDEFSMSPANLPYTKDKIRSISLAEAKEIADKVLTMDSAIQIQKYLEGLN